MGFLSNLRKDLQTQKRKKASEINGKNLKGLLKKLKEERDRIEKELVLGHKLMILHRCLCKKF
ncbi:MAG: hypothetical protein OEL84_05345 [Nitrosopumilus sp.]|nr:hypothetical protein [Nitrosopumilus sp.]MDH3340695.1 hypothetical protein [Nitrosopumilus sp.]